MRTGILHIAASDTPRRSSASVHFLNALVIIIAIALPSMLATAAEAEDHIRHVALDPQEATERGLVDVNVSAEDVSLLVNLVLNDRQADIGIVRVIDPSGVIVHDTTFEDDSWDSAHFESDIVAEAIVGAGEVSVLLPTSPDIPLQTGRYRITFEVDPPDARLHRVEHVARRHADVTKVDQETQAIDLSIHVFENHAGAERDRLIAAIDTDWRNAIDRMLTPHAMTVGNVTVAFASQDSRQRLADLDDEPEMEQACLEMRSAESPTIEPLHIGLVSAIPDTGHGASDDGITGLSPQPGNPFDDASPNACLYIATRVWRDEALDNELITAMLTANLVHELGHFAGLSHPSEADGVTFDVLDDTPVCSREDHSTCTRAEGAGNVMFHSGGVEGLPYALTKSQAWVLRRHPLFHRTPKP